MRVDLILRNAMSRPVGEKLESSVGEFAPGA